MTLFELEAISSINLREAQFNIHCTYFKNVEKQIRLEIWFEIPIGIQDKKLLNKIIDEQNFIRKFWIVQ